MMVLRGGGLEVAALRSDGQEFNCSSRVSLLHVRELHVAATWRRWGYHGIAGKHQFLNAVWSASTRVTRCTHALKATSSRQPASVRTLLHLLNDTWKKERHEYMFEQTLEIEHHKPNLAYSTCHSS